GLDRIGRIVLTNCDSYEHFPPKGFDTMVAISRRVPPAGKLLLRFFATRLGQRAFLTSVCSNPPKGPRAREVFEAFVTTKASRQDALRVTQSLEPSVTLDAVDALRSFDRPVLLAWGDKDKLFPLAHARRLEVDFPNARLQVFTGASTYVMLDQPSELAAAIDGFVATS
ncbi:MAG: putative hydrolase, partial [Acidimicrobiales bacterium]|nr:putative hydrolase [Acidimicrobiales bacterium]